MEDMNKRLPEALGDRIAFLRKLKGMTQAQLAERMGISAQAVSKWESGLSCPDIMMLVPLAEIFGVSTDVLLGGGTIGGENIASGDACQEKNQEDNEEQTAQEASDKEDNEPIFTLKEDSHKSKEVIHSLFIDIAAVETLIKEGDEFALDLSSYPNGDCKEEIRDGVWRIKEKGFKVAFFGLGSLNNLLTERRIVITIPRGYHFDNVKIRLGAGRLVGKGIIADTSDIDLGAGELVVADYHSGPAKIKCGMGKIMLEGSMWGKCKLDCGMGEIAASISTPKDYGYKVNVGMGEVRIGADKFSGMGGSYKVNTDAFSFFDINCSMGSVKMVFPD